MKTAEQVDNLIAKLKKKETPIQDIAWKAALACVGWPYVYSAWGALCTPGERRKRYKMCPSHTTIKTKCKGFDSGNCSGCQWFPDEERVRCFDCRGFTDWILKQIGFDLYGDTCGVQWNHKANWSRKGEIATMPKDTLCCLFVYKNGKWNHTGFGLNNETVECSSGVQHFTTRNKKWTHWAVPACIEGTITTTTPDDDDDEDVGFPDPSPRRLSIRRGDKGDDVKECQTMLKALGYDLGKCGIDGDYGSMTRLAVICFQRDHGLVADGICGPLTWDALDTAFKASAGTPVTSAKSYSVIIRGLDQTQAQALAANYPASSEIIEGSDGK